MKKLPLKKVQKISILLLAIGFLIICIGAHLRWMPLTLLGLLPWLGASVVGFLFYRCPHCGKFLGRADGKYCPFCGKKLDM